jgi:hypothetical protein
MIRLIGMLTGSALAVAAIVLTLGLPELAAKNDVPVQAPPLVVYDTPAAVVAAPAIVSQPEATPNNEVNIAASSDAALPAATVTEDATGVTPETVAEAATDPVVMTPAASPSQNWFAFWSPFRSEIAADGFIAELQRTTGLDYRVVKLKPGVYEVAFAYSDPLDRDTKLDRITAATGLDMSGG